MTLAPGGRGPRSFLVRMSRDWWAVAVAVAAALLVKLGWLPRVPW
jgi:hypothetical protein